VSDVLAGSLVEEESIPTSPSEITEETGELPEQTDLDQISVHVNYGDRKGSVVLSELAAKTVLSVLRSVNFPSSAAMLQVGIAMQELEKGLLALEGQSGDSFPAGKLSRAERRRMLRS
jgi:hypothetical protein